MSAPTPQERHTLADERLTYPVHFTKPGDNDQGAPRGAELIASLLALPVQRDGYSYAAFGPETRAEMERIRASLSPQGEPRFTVTKRENGASIRVNDQNPKTRYLPPRDAFDVEYAPAAPQGAEEPRPIQRGDAVEGRMRDGSVLPLKCWFVCDDPEYITVCNDQNMGLAGWRRRLHRDPDGTHWVHEYEEDDIAAPSPPVRPLEESTLAQAELPADVAQKILAARNALVGGDTAEAYHQLYAIACPGFDSLTPWAGLEAAALAPAEPRSPLGICMQCGTYAYEDTQVGQPCGQTQCAGTVRRLPRQATPPEGAE